MQARRALERSRRRPLISTQEASLRLGGGGPIRAFSGAGENVESRLGESLGATPIAADQPQRGGVDRGVVAAGAGKDSAVELCRKPRTAAPLTTSAGERRVFGDARPQRQYLLVRAAPERIPVKSASRFLGGAGAREREHRPVLEGQVTGMFLQAAFGEVEGGQQLAAPLLAPDGVQPPGGGVPLEIIREPLA